MRDQMAPVVVVWGFVNLVSFKSSYVINAL